MSELKLRPPENKCYLFAGHNTSCPWAVRLAITCLRLQDDCPRSAPEHGEDKITLDSQNLRGVGSDAAPDVHLSHSARHLAMMISRQSGAFDEFAPEVSL